MFDGDNAAGAGESDSAKTDAESTKQDATKNEAAKAEDAGADDAIKRELRARANKLQEERDALLKEKADRDAVEQKRKDKEAAEAGKWEELATARENDLTAAKADVTRLTGENDQLRTAITGVLDSEWKDLPAEVTDAYLGADDDPLAKLAFLPKGKVLAAKLAEKAETQRGNGRDPKPSGAPNGVSDDAARRANASRYA